MTFVDTNVWFAAYIPGDDHHAAVVRWMASTATLVTTDHVVAESLTLFRARGRAVEARRFARDLFDGAIAELLFTGPDEFAAAHEVFAGFADKGWSFCDCLSYATIRRLNVRAAASYDRHFDQFGIAEVIRP